MPMPTCPSSFTYSASAGLPSEAVREWWVWLTMAKSLACKPSTVSALEACIEYATLPNGTRGLISLSVPTARPKYSSSCPSMADARVLLMLPSITFKSPSDTGTEFSVVQYSFHKGVPPVGTSYKRNSMLYLPVSGMPSESVKRP